MEYLENPNAPTFRAHGLHELNFISDTDGLFTLYCVRRTAGGVLYRETALWVEMPIAAIPPAVALTARTLAAAVLMPIKDATARALGMH